MNKLKVGDKIWSEYFKSILVITKIFSDEEWYFRHINEPNIVETKAQTPLSYFEKI